MRESLATIRRNVQLEARLIDDLLDLARVRNGKLQLHPRNGGRGTIPSAARAGHLEAGDFGE